MQNNIRNDLNSLDVIQLEEYETVKAFDCGDTDLNEFILRESPLYQKEKLAVTYVMKEATDIDNEQIVAFCPRCPLTGRQHQIRVKEIDNAYRH